MSTNSTRWLITALAIVLAFTLSACGGPAAQETVGEAPATEEAATEEAATEEAAPEEAAPEEAYGRGRSNR